jgi:class I fructose-bisphosphate aldolase/fructose-bisphosphate aldolase/2-amino-3,7-dideoxy-D-threo-hept-6-ulosonate synthase
MNQPLRMQHIFHPDGRAVVIALDFGMGGSGIPELGTKIPQIVAGGADSVLLTYGLALNYGHLLKGCGMLLSMTDERDDTEESVLQALRLGADGIKVMAFTHRPEQTANVNRLVRLSVACHAWGMPLLAEMIPVSFEAKEAHTPEKIAQTAQHGIESGAHCLKIHYTGNPETFRPIAQACPVPIIVLGGPRTNDDRAFLANIKSAIDAGAAGVAIGRNVWGHPHPERMTAALAAIVHGNATVDEAVREMGGK